MAGDLSPDLERCLEAGAEQMYICDRLPSEPVPWDRVGAPVKTLYRDRAAVALSSFLAVRAQCGTCGGTGEVPNPLGRLGRSEHLHVTPKKCPDCRGGAPLEVLVPSTRLEPLGVVSDFGGGWFTVLVDRDLTDYPALRVPIYALRDQEGSV